MFQLLKKTVVHFLCAATLYADEPKVVRLEPPKLCEETISEKIVCTRPWREGTFNISLEHTNGKTVVNCYGHGGSGWSTLFGSVNKAIALLKETNPKMAPIRVIGSGCMGLTTAIELARLGYPVSGIYTKSLYDIPSWKAGGYFGLASKNHPLEEQKELNELCLETFLIYRQIENGKHPYISKEAIRFLPVYGKSDIKSGIDDLEERGLIPPREYVSLDFGNGVVHHGFVKLMSYFLNTGALMRELTQEVARLNIDVEIREIQSFDDISEEVIFNCSGLGGRELNSDEKMTPIRGHLITLKPSAGTKHMDYMLFTRVLQGEKLESLHLFPKTVSVTAENPGGIACCGFLGGTFISDDENLSSGEREKQDSLEFKRLLDRHSEFFYGRPYQK